ncbi:arylesterase [Afipia carboxidovorans]|nr:arylesterase [Afipia carboxidovorans]
MPLPYGSFAAAVERRARMFLVAAACLAVAGSSGVMAQTFTPPLKLAVLGDSLTAGYGLPASAAFPVRLQQALKDKGIATEIVNAGVSGDTASGGRDRLDWSIPEGTQAVLVELGANDMLRGVDPKVTRAALDDIITRLKARGIAVMLCGMYAAPNLGEAYGRAFNSIYPELAKKHGVPLYPFFLDGVTQDAAMKLPDGLHPTAAGVDVIVARILPAVEAFLKELPVTSAVR